MMYRLWNEDTKVWFKETYDNITEARKSAYRKRCDETLVCSHNPRSRIDPSGNKNWYALGIVMNKRYNMYGVPIYISYAGKDGATYVLNSDGTLGKKLD